MKRIDKIQFMEIFCNVKKIEEAKVMDTITSSIETHQLKEDPLSKNSAKTNDKFISIWLRGY